MITLGSANLWNYDGNNDELTALLARQNAHVLMVQELVSSPRGVDLDEPAERRRAAARVLRKLADDLNMNCLDTVEAVGTSLTRHHTGLLWHNDLHAIPGSLMRYDSHIYRNSHGMVTIVLDVGGKKLRVASAHLSPTDPGMSAGYLDAGLIHRALHREDGIPGLVGGDWQGIGSDVKHDPHPYLGVEWNPAIAYHYDNNGRVDRDAAYRLEQNFRFKDCQIFTGTRWAQTTGHHRTDRQPPRRIDRIYATHDFPDDALVALRTLSPAEVGQCSDHCPVLVDIDETEL
ncbi:hypothetical protein [Amycolatopsis kentuckyensis]|uniref:hypothetical protein n=1 Tax=Amycolatopsis kentuckyensis TaxID=218823 RepID=UPI003564EEAF